MEAQCNKGCYAYEQEEKATYCQYKGAIFLLDGFSLAEFLFFEAEVGKTIGPIQGPDGWFIARVNTRTPARRKIDVKNERERELVREDFLTVRFLDWAREVVGRAKFE